MITPNPARVVRASHIVLLLVIVAGGRVTATAADLWTTDARPERVRFTNQFDIGPVIDGDMGGRLAGVLLELDGAGIDELQACIVEQSPDAPEHAETAECYFQLFAGDSITTFAVWPAGPDSFVAAEVDANDAQAMVHLDASRFRKLLARGALYRGGFDASDVGVPSATTGPMTPPYVPSPIYLDKRTLEYRMFRDMPEHARDVERNLDEANFVVRLPQGYDPRRPAGLLVWCSPLEQAVVPRVFHKALDELYVICVGTADAGNLQMDHPRFQLMLDAATNAQRRFHVDPRRVYLTGMSGGGRVTSVLCICFPDVFKGGVPIVGFNSYSNLRTTHPTISKPLDERLALARKIPLALMSGPPDFNYDEMRERMHRLEQDGFTGLRFFDYPDMAHVMPKPDRFLDALSFVDEGYAAIRQAEERDAARLLDAYVETYGEGTPTTDAQRIDLAEVMRVGPWTDAAWRAFELLKASSS